MTTKTLPETFTIQDDFPPIAYEQWREVVDQSLKGAPFEKKLVTHTYDGIDIQPIYGRENAGEDGEQIGLPGFFPFVRDSQPLGAVSTGWDLRQEHAHPDLQVTQKAIVSDIHGGVTSVLLRLDAAACNGFDPDDEGAAELVGNDGLMAFSVDDLDAALAELQLDKLGISLDAGAAVVPAAASLAALWQRRGVSPEQARGAFNADPLAVLASSGQLPQSIDAAQQSLAELAKWTAASYPHVTSVGVDTTPYHHAGATASQDIAFAVATAVEYLRAMLDAGMSIDDAAGQISFRMALGTHHFLAIAKIRAARWVWARAVEACGGSRAAQAMKIHTRTSNRVLTHYDPYVNLLRNSVAVFAAGVGGADAITSVPFDSMMGLPNEFSRRVARNSVLVLQDESHLHRVIDPAGGSWFLDQLTEQVGEKAWEVFQETESQGGMGSALKSGWVSQQIDAAYIPRAKDIARRKEGITGVSEFPDAAEERISQPPLDVTAIVKKAKTRIAGSRKSDSPLDGLKSAADAVAAAADGATIGQIANGLGFRSGTTESISPIKPRNFAEPFEQLRDACDTWLATHGQRPRVFLANFGPVAHHTGRATWSKNLFEAGGFEVIGNNGFEDVDAAASALSESGAAVAVICSSDKLYPDVVPPAAAKLKGAGAQSVVLAGHPGDNEQSWKAAGVDRFIFMKCNVLETLRELLSEQGVLETGEPTHE